MEEKKEKKAKKVFRQGAIDSNFIADAIAKHQVKTQIGAHQIFLGQVRADQMEGKTVCEIDYSAHEAMAEGVIHEIREEAFARFSLSCLHIYHSLGPVKAGEICLFVFVSSAHRQAAFDACHFLVEQIKSRAPIFGKEIFEDASHSWKVNH